ncbi:MAG: 30S ribosomal protein S13 [Nitrososphaerota archaeon]|jgi:small subunit ribosomal protein S13|uniref:30S ribosomal protein S13 n=1 Tax=Candidatus Bathycorpusculum sp. TaxID=2994959 RepID=UPI002822C89B|nr:30S ribosomal protein S13 [Candidatus Termitimicrobium sp.]MCL2432372.1 30S ribosomal protein S13 [Candidatus Termitimicrobium sp.]MDR0492702.1 30S ribosomal protein S13 [Nitrososphaerota archaeon]
MSQEYRYIVRIMGTDVQGTVKVSYAVAHVKGVSSSLSNAILKEAGVNPDLRVGLIADSDIGKIEDVIRDPAKYSIPGWMYNRRKDSDTGKDMHVLGADLAFKIKNDIDGAKEIRSWRGYRHAYSLKVRGQRTKTTGRAGKALGVKKKTMMQKSGSSDGGK